METYTYLPMLPKEANQLIIIIFFVVLLMLLLVQEFGRSVGCLCLRMSTLSTLFDWEDLRIHLLFVH